jgi:hypothetical protein
MQFLTVPAAYQPHCYPSFTIVSHKVLLNSLISIVSEPPHLYFICKQRNKRESSTNYYQISINWQQFRMCTVLLHASAIAKLIYKLQMSTVSMRNSVSDIFFCGIVSFSAIFSLMHVQLPECAYLSELPTIYSQEQLTNSLKFPYFAYKHQKR